jgi:hypothetical protein
MARSLWPRPSISDMLAKRADCSEQSLATLVTMLHDRACLRAE